jgi:integrase
MTVRTASGGRKDITLGVHKSPESKAEYERQLALLRANPTQVAGRPDISVAEICVAFYGHAEKHYRHPDGRPTSELHCYKAATRPLRQLYGTTPAAEFGPQALKAVRADMIARGWCRKTVNKHVGRIKSVFRWAISEELIPGDVLPRLASVSGLQRGRTAASETEPVGPVDDATVDATLPHVPRAVRGLIQFQRLTGCRPGEACALTLSAIDRTGAVWLYRPRQHKNSWRGRSRVIAIGPKCRALLAEFATGDPAAPVFASRGGRAYTVSGYRQAIDRGVDAANAEQSRDPACGPALPRVPHWHPNQLRHSFATKVRKLHGLEAAQVLLGHARADVSEIYAEKNTALAASVAAQIG